MSAGEDQTWPLVAWILHDPLTAYQSISTQRGNQYGLGLDKVTMIGNGQCRLYSQTPPQADVVAASVA
jgi:hypothetical protein